MSGSYYSETEADSPSEQHSSSASYEYSSSSKKVSAEASKSGDGKKNDEEKASILDPLVKGKTGYAGDAEAEEDESVYTCGCIAVRSMYALIVVVSILFALYIIFIFLIHPWYTWETVSKYKKTASGAAAICIHWVGGVMVMLLGPLQLIRYIRVNYAWIHRWTGRAYVAFGLITCFGGTLYIILRGTVGGPSMTAAFIGYVLIYVPLLVMTIWRAREKKYSAHRAWALRAFAVGIGSALYRVLISPLFVASVMPKSVFDSWSDDDKLLWLNIASWLFYIPNLLCMEAYVRATSNGQDIW